MSRTPSLSLLSLSLGAALAAGAGCSKKKADAPVEPESTASKSAESDVDPRLVDPPGGANPHGDPAAQTPSSPQGDPAAQAAPPSPHGGGPTAGGGGGRVPEKTADGRAILRDLTAAVPAGWQERPTSSGMRVAQWAIPGKDGDGELVTYYFGAGGAGGAEANLQRWISQFEQADGSPTADKTRTEKKTVAGMAVTLVEVTGRYVAQVMPGGTEKNDKPGYMMLGAIVETPSAGPYYFKAVGPETTMKAAKKAFADFVGSLQPAAK